jgi:hypothetical protein
MSEWPFTDPPNFNAFSTRQVIERGDPILLVAHEEDDGAWQFIGGAWNENDLVVICLEHAVALDPSVRELADLPRGWTAVRKGPGQPWNRHLSPLQDE